MRRFGCCARAASGQAAAALPSVTMNLAVQCGLPGDTLPWGSCPCNEGTIPRFHRAVCGYSVLEGQPAMVDFAQQQF